MRRYRIQVRGVVQGVGFRPFVYRLATGEGLSGSIGNDTEGVAIEVEGPRERLAVFLKRLTSEVPPLARIDSIAVEEIPPGGEADFRIVSSEVRGEVSTGIPADAATCPECLGELFDPSDRRYRYPFLNCTNCGPRFTITRQIPYDRPQTSMAAFRMCACCQAEYEDPANRRFHAEPNACRDCGPAVWLEDAAGQTIAVPDPVEDAIRRLLEGQIVAVKGVGGFHLGADATNQAAVSDLRVRKRRPERPLAVMVRNLAMAWTLCELSAAEEALLESPSRPIVLARARPGNGIAPAVAPATPWLGVFLPHAPLEHLLFADRRIRALVMTSANLSEEPIAIDNDEARSRLCGIADALLMHNREIVQRADDSVAAVIDGIPQLLRRARGFVPLDVPLPLEAPPLVAAGGHLKSVFTLARGRLAYQSQHLGDLESPSALEFFTDSLAHLMRTFEIRPELVVHDLHPGYLSTGWARQWAAERGLPVIAVQHHHAHVAACMAEHALEGPVIGLSLDGTGFGTDGRIWGGEVLIAGLAGFERFAHLDYVPMPGGEAAIREPWRMALGHLHASGADLEGAGRFLGATPAEIAVLVRMIERGINTPWTSSCGRLFDAVAAVVLNRRTVDYEAQAAMELEGAAAELLDQDDGYRMEIIEGDWGRRVPARLSPTSLWHQLVADLALGEPAELIAGRVHAGIGDAFVAAAALAREATGIGQVVMSGGCMFNRRLARLVRRGLEAQGFAVFRHVQVSPGDGGLSYGQAAVAAAMIRAEGTADPLLEGGG